MIKILLVLIFGLLLRWVIIMIFFSFWLLLLLLGLYFNILDFDLLLELFGVFKGLIL